MQTSRYFRPIVLLGALAFALTSAAATRGSSRALQDVPPERILYAFQGGGDGANPQAGVFADATGALYGTTARGGTGGGTVFNLTPGQFGYSKSVLYAFRGGKDGADPSGNLIADSSGAFFGTTFGGGSVACGTTYKLTPHGSPARRASRSVLRSTNRWRDGSDASES